MEADQEMIDVIQTYAQSASTEDSNISVQTNKAVIPSKTRPAAGSENGWWITCGVIFILLTVVLPISYVSVLGGIAFDIEFNNQGDLWVVTNQPRVLMFHIPGP
jgi:hypothetical protein